MFLKPTNEATAPSNEPCGRPIKKISKNNILVIEFNNKGLVKNKKLVNLNDMNELKYVKKITTKEFEQDNTIYNIFSSLREKVNAPARNRTNKD